MSSLVSFNHFVIYLGGVRETVAEPDRDGHHKRQNASGPHRIRRNRGHDAGQQATRDERMKTTFQRQARSQISA